MSRATRGRGKKLAAASLVGPQVVGICLAALVFACSFAPADANGHRVRRTQKFATRAAALPPQGIFETCPLDSMLATCTQRLATMRQAGVDVVVVPASGASLDALANYGQAARSLGMSVMWELSNPVWWREPATATDAAASFSGFASACGCQSNQDVLAYTIQWLASQPATYGYYAADDSMLEPGDQAGVSAYVAQIKQRDAVHPVMIGAFQPGQRQQYVDIADLIGQEVYPITTDRLLPAAKHRSTWSYIDDAVSGEQQAASQAGKGSAFILQAFTWGDNVADGSAIGVCSKADSTASCNARLRYPSGAEQLAIRNAVLTRARPQLILWWSFQGTTGLPAADDYFAPVSPDEAAARWAGLSSVIAAPPSTSPSRQRLSRPRGGRRRARSHRRYAP